MKRLLLVTDYFRPEPGGLEFFFSSLAYKRPPEKIEVIVTNREKNYLSSSLQIRKFDSQQAYQIHRPELMAIPFFFFGTDKTKRFFLNSFRQYLKSSMPEHILFSGVSFLHCFLARQAMALNIPYSFILHGYLLHSQLNRFHFWNQYYIRHSKRVFALSWHLGRIAIRSGLAAEKICVLPPAFLPPQKPSKDVIPSWLKKRIAKKTLLLSLGPLVARKGFEKGIEAMRFLVNQLPKLHYIIVGSGPEFSYLKEQARALKLSAHITMTGFITDELRFALLSKSRVLLQPGSKREDDIESLGFVFMEAAWFGVPVVCGKVGGVEEVVFDTRTGFLTKVGDIEELTQKIYEIISSAKLYQKISQKAKSVARKQFLMSHLLRKIESELR